MARTKKVVNEAIPLPQVEKEYYKCPCCGKKYTDQDKGFYQSNSLLMKNNNGRMVICRKCCIELYAYLVNNNEDTKESLYLLCRWLDLYFDANLYASSEIQARNANTNIAQVYITKINSLPQYTSLTFANSTRFDGKKEDFLTSKEEVIDNKEGTELDKRNKDDVIRMVGYDPFENENPMDKKGLYNTLVDFLDESTLEDSFKLPTVIEIVKSFNQIDKINQALAIMTTDVNNIANSVGGVKSLFEAKDKMYRALLALAKDNGISVNHATNKSKGAGTLSGIMKQLQEKGFMEAEVNIYDIETCEGMKQVSDISNKSIMQQLQFDENDYTDMINDQRIIINETTSRLAKLEEENRLLKLKLRSGDIIDQ